MSLKKHIPNLLTLSNLLCGVLGIVYAMNGNLQMAAYLIWLAAIFDFLDGFAARKLNVSTPIGKELDSLADMVTFGVLPSIIIYKMVPSMSDSWAYLSFSIALFSALRLAKFNIDSRQTDQFIGLPTPASAFFISALPFIVRDNLLGIGNLLNGPVLLSISVVLSLLLVSEIRLFSLKFKDFKWENNSIRFIFALISVILLVLLKIASIPVIILLYMVLSLLNLKTSK